MSAMSERVQDSYDAAAAAYADALGDELDGKPLDRHLLNRFAEALRDRGLVADLGCGPGHIARYLHERSVAMIGIDLSPAMIAVATARNPEIEFRTGDMRALVFDDGSVAGIVAFYSIIHFDAAELPSIFREMRRVLAPDGLALVAFHLGTEIVHRDDLFGVPVSLDFRFHERATVVAALRDAGFAVIEEVEREPYAGPEFPSRRCYLLARATCDRLR